MMSSTYVWRPSSARLVVLDGFSTPLRPSTISVAEATPITPSWPTKDPGDVLDYQLDVSNALAGDPSDSIDALSAAISPAQPGDLTLVSAAMAGSAAVLWLSAGQVGTTYTVTLTISTTSGRTLVRSVLLPVENLTVRPPASTNLTTETGTTLTDQNGTPLTVGP
jgi:hypothetical protein